MQRKPGTLTPLEVQILSTALRMAAAGERQFHGFLLAKRMKEAAGARFRTAYGPLYKALDRMAANGLLASEWEDPEVAAQERRPRRCFYWVTSAGQLALETHLEANPGARVEGEAAG